MKTKQHSINVLEVDLKNEKEFVSFFDMNYQIFKNHLIAINGEESLYIKEYLDKKDLKYIFNKVLPKKQSRQKKIIEKEKHLKVVDDLVRSGNELKVDGDLLLLNRVNSGASVVVNGSLIITEIVDGFIRCDGNFMMLKTSNKANVIFHGVEIDNDLLKDKLNRVELIENEIKITPVLKEKNWV